MEAVRHNTRTHIQRGREDLIDQTRLTPKTNRQIKASQNKHYKQIAELTCEVPLALSLRGNVNISVSLQFSGAAHNGLRVDATFPMPATPGRQSFPHRWLNNEKILQTH